MFIIINPLTTNTIKCKTGYQFVHHHLNENYWPIHHIIHQTGFSPSKSKFYSYQNRFPPLPFCVQFDSESKANHSKQIVAKKINKKKTVIHPQLHSNLGGIFLLCHYMESILDNYITIKWINQIYKYKIWQSQIWIKVLL